jgi:predicted dehydrogenase
MTVADPHSTSSASPDTAAIPSLSRRTFLRSASVGAAAVTFGAGGAFAQAPSKQLNIAIVGCGEQGLAQINAMRELVLNGSVRVLAMADPWQFNLDYRANSFEKLVKGAKVNRYSDLSELLAKEESLDAVFIASPDYLHEPHTTMALKAGKHVYCEKMMSNTVEAARKMVISQQETGKLCQVGHQRRSNPRYLRLRQEIIGAPDGTAKNLTGKSLLGEITHAYAQWNREVKPPLGFPKKFPMPPEALATLGYENMEQFRNWRFYKKFGGGAISDLGAHQIDLFNWMLGTTPVSITATGGRDYYDGKGLMPDGQNVRPAYETDDNVIVTYEYNVNGRTVRCIYTVLTTTSSQAIYEKFMGDQASVVISEDLKNNQVYRENNALWDGQQLVEAGTLASIPGSVHHKFWESPKPWWQEDKWLTKVGVKAGAVDARESKATGAYELPEVLNKLPHTPHIENFVKCCLEGKSQTDLNCPVADAYKTCVTVLKCNQAIAEKKTIIFDPSEFAV